MKARICVVQINYMKDDPDGHIERMKGIISEHASADLIVFPELILHGHPSAEIPEGLLYRKMRVHHAFVSEDMYEFVRRAGARVIIGELRRQREKYFNVATYIDSGTVQSYTKTHVHWSENFVAGGRLKTFDTPLGKVGITICFDAAFPEVWRVLALNGADIIVNISAVPRSFPVKYMWRRMQGAALNNQVFVIYANRPGEHFSGYSAVLNPQGDIVVHADDEEAVIQAEIDLDDVWTWRDEEVIYPNRRPLLYREITKKNAQSVTPLTASSGG
ncbi:MAG: carbon-nitrogen hydrolase family protein [Candidatus Sulfobium sp.]